MRATRDGFGQGLLEAGEDSRVVVLTADLTDSTRVEEFAKTYPDRFVETGVSEQNMMSAAAGMAHVGKVPFVCSFSAFNPGRNWDQLRVSVCYSNHNVKIIGSHAGLTVGEDGASHQALEDVAMTRVLPNLVVLVPCDAEEARKAVHAALAHEGPVYIRLGRAGVPDVTRADTPFAIGNANVLRDGNDVTIAAMGVLVAEALQAAELLAQEGISARVLNCASVKPLDEDAIVAAAVQTAAVVTAEEHQVMGGLGGAVAEVLASNHPVPVERVGVHDRFGESGPADELLDKYGLRAADIVEAAKRAIARKSL